jgi:hypothetical protein
MDDAVRKTGPDWVVARERKIAFTFDDARLKVSTVASFKGWSSSRVILVLPAGRPKPDSRLLRQVYVGLTRSEGEAFFVGRPGESFGIDDLGLPRPKIEVDREAAKRFTELALQNDAESARRTVPGGDLEVTEPLWLNEQRETRLS